MYREYNVSVQQGTSEPELYGDYSIYIGKYIFRNNSESSLIVTKE